MHISESLVQINNSKIRFGNITKMVQSSAVQSVVKNTAEKFDTSLNLNKILFEAKTGLKLTSKDIIKLNSNNKIFQLSKEIQELLDEICFLHKNINTQILTLSNSTLYKLKKEYPNFSGIKPYASITFNRGDEKISFHNNLTNSSNNIKIITVHNKNSDSVEKFPIINGKILKVQDNVKINKLTSSLNNINENCFMTEDEINSAKLLDTLNFLKKELVNITEIILNGGGIINEDLSENIINCEKEIVKIKKQVASKKIRPKNFTLYSNGAIIFNNINSKGEKLYWLPAKTNKKASETTIIQLLSSDNKLVDAVAINDERVLANYPLEHKDNFPQNMIFLTSEELKKLEIEDKIDLFVRYFNDSKNAFYNEFEKQIALKKQFSKIF